MSRHFQRAQVLLEQGRHEQALGELEQHLADDPGNPLAHALMAHCLTESNRHREATEQATLAIQAAPDQPFGHYALAQALYHRNRYKPALEAISEAIRLDPENSSYYALLAGIHFDQSRWSQALAAAEQGLAIDPEDSACINLRAMSLVKLGRKNQAGAAIQAALARRPEDALTHANQGWTLLEQRRPKQAIDHFREALRLDPDLDWAREGLVEAIKARHLIYRVMLGYFLWMAKLTSRQKWTVLIGGYIGIRVLRNAAPQAGPLEPLFLVIVILYVGFALMTWVAVPLFNLSLRLNRDGRLALSREQVVASNWFGLCAAAALGSLLLYAVGGNSAAMIVAIVLGCLLVPVSAVWQCPTGRPRRTMAGFTCLLAGVGLLAILSSLPLAGGIELPDQVFRGALGAFLLGIISSQWLANALMGYRPAE